jgi:hypothetical protein
MNLHDLSYDSVFEMSTGEGGKMLRIGRRVEISPQKRNSHPQGRTHFKNPSLFTGESVMTSRSSRHFAGAGLLLLLALGGFSLSPVRADLHSMVQDAHHDLEQALNPGGDTPSDTDRTNYLNAALDALKDLPPIRHPRRLGILRDDIRSALEEIKNGDPNHQAANDIRDADSIVRDLESSS